MSTDKFGELDQAIADIFKESRQAPIKAKPSLADFDHETLADMFNDSGPVSSNPEPSPSRVDHRGLAEIFGEPTRAPIDRPPLDIDQSPHLFGEPGHGKTATHYTAERAPPPVPGSVQPNRAESLLDKIRYIFTPKADARPHAPPAAAERAPWQDAKRPLTESPLGFEPDSLLFRSADRLGERQQARDDVADAFWDQTDETSQTGQTAPPSLADIISSVSTDIHPPVPATDDHTGSQSATDDEAPAAEAAATRNSEDSWQQLESLLTERSLSRSPNALPLSSRRETSRQVQQPDEPEREADTAPADAESHDLATALDDASPAIPTEATPYSPQAQDVAPDERCTVPSDDAETANISADSLADIESTPRQQSSSSPAELPLGSSTEQISPSTNREADTTGVAIPDPANDPVAAADDVPDAPLDDDQNASKELHEAALLPSDVPPLQVTPETGTSALANEPDPIDSVAEIAAAILSSNAESVDRKQREPQASAPPLQRDPSTTRSSDPINALPAIRPYQFQVAAMQPYQSPPLRITVRPTGPSRDVEGERTHDVHSARLDRTEPVKNTTAIHPLAQTQIPPPSQTKSLQAENPDAVSIAISDPAPPEGRFLQQQTGEQLDDPAAGTTTTATDPTIAPLADGTPEFEEKSLLSELDLESAIRLRWVMRDIRANRMGMSPASESDLAALAELGLVEIRGELPYLTASGARELN